MATRSSHHARGGTLTCDVELARAYNDADIPYV